MQLNILSAECIIAIVTCILGIQAKLRAVKAGKV